MADVSNQEIKEAYEDVRSDKSETTWLMIGYESARSNTLRLTATGSGDLTELKDHVRDDEASFAYVRVSYANDKESTREKFIFVVWIGPDCGIMRKAKVSVHTGDVKRVLPAFSIEVSAREKEDLNQDHIVLRLRKAGGASYDGV